MAREKFTLIPEVELNALSIKERIKQGEITNEVYDAMTADEQAMVRNILFEAHAQPVPTPAALSAIEFAVFGLAKIFFKKDEGVILTEEEQAFYDRFKSFIEKHEITMNAGDWYVPYAESHMLAVQENRGKYKQEKVDITGQF